MRRLHSIFFVMCASIAAGCGASQRVAGPEQPGASSAPAPDSSPPAPAAVVEPAPPVSPVASTPHKRLTNGLASLRAVCEVTLLALKENSQETLDALRVTQEEYKQHIFPEFPEAGPGNTIPVDFQWFHFNMKCLKGIRNALDSYGGLDLELLEPVVTKGIGEYRTYRMHKDVEMKVRNKATGKEAQIRVFASVVEMDGEFKIFAYPS